MKIYRLKVCSGLFTLTFMIVSFVTTSSADTVALKNGERTKGLILEEFTDRIVMSTAGGEKVFFKNDIRHVYYDDKVKALLQKGKNQIKRGQYVKAYYTYGEALEIDPDSREAKDRYNYLRSYLEKKIKNDRIRKILKKKEQTEGIDGKTSAEEASKQLGVVLKSDGEYITVEKVLKGNGSNTKDILRPGDKIISVWGENTKYMDADEVAEMMLSPSETKMVIERQVFPKLSSFGGILPRTIFKSYRSIIGASLTLNKKGLTINRASKTGPFSSVGIKDGDLLASIKGESTRYMPLKDVVRIIKNNQDEVIDITIRRNVCIWSKGRNL